MTTGLPKSLMQRNEDGLRRKADAVGRDGGGDFDIRYHRGRCRRIIGAVVVLEIHIKPGVQADAIHHRQAR